MLKATVDMSKILFYYIFCSVSRKKEQIQGNVGFRPIPSTENLHNIRIGYQEKRKSNPKNFKQNFPRRPIRPRKSQGIKGFNFLASQMVKTLTTRAAKPFLGEKAFPYLGL
jgi:hypothetical protein